VRTRAPNEILQIPRDASPAEIVAAVTARTAHFRALSTQDSVHALSEIYQAAAFLLWETKHDPEARTTSDPFVSTTPLRRQRAPLKPQRKRRRKTSQAWAPLLIVAPTIAALAVFLLYPDATMSAAWKLVDQASAAREGLSESPVPTLPANPTPTLHAITTTSSVAVSPAILPHSETVVAPAITPTSIALTQTGPEVQACVVISSLNVRSGPGVAYPKQSYLLAGECVKLVAINQAGTWGIIHSTPRPAAEYGWASIAFLESDMSMRALPVATPHSQPSPTPNTDRQ
jgi:hypothetical protein